MYIAKNGSLQNILPALKEGTFVIVKNHASALIKKERLGPMSKARREASRNKFVKTVGCQKESKT